MTMPTLNERANELASLLAADAERIRVAVHALDCGTRVIDCGVNAPGSLEAGRRLAEICLAGLGSVYVKPANEGKENGHQVHVTTNAPVAACMASQYAGWEIKGNGFFAMGSGPMRAAAGREELFDTIDYRERPPVAVGVLEASKLPTESVSLDIAAKCGIEPERLTLLVARTASAAGTVQIVARSIETALHKLHVLGFDLTSITSGIGVAPLPPVASDDLTAVGWTNDAILYGARVTLLTNADDAALQDVGPRVPSSASPDYGRPFAEIFSRYGSDFYKIDPMLFSPAQVTFVNVANGRRYDYGQLAPELLIESFRIEG
jgi:methenyltetrahydromethanopterin cyclohydrolase